LIKNNANVINQKREVQEKTNSRAYKKKNCVKCAKMLKVFEATKQK